VNTENSSSQSAPQTDFGRRIAAWLGLILVVFGMVNAMPTFPGLDAWAAEMVGDINFVFRRFPFEYLYPIAFLLMMTVVVLQHSFYRDRKNEGTNRRAVALLIDIGFFAATVLIVATYWTEIESVCVIDVVTGERQALMAKALAAEREMAQMMGMPLPETIENPACINTTGVWIFAIFSFALLMFLVYNVKVWGFSLVAVAMVVVAYTLGTVIIWYFFGADDISKYLATKLGGEPRTLVDGIPNVRDVLINSGKGLLGEFMGILLNVVFPYIVLGSLFGVSAGGQSLIRLAFLVTRKLRGGPAHAAIVSSALFGTISGGPVVNVMSTGVLTIPMMIKRGFHKTFAGGVEAAASSGGQIMPPVMGVAAFVLASITMVPYSEVIIAAVIPSVAYFGALFLTVVFQARKQGIQAYGEVQDFMVLSREDKKNLLMIFLPILTVLFILLSPKETIGCGYLGGLMGATQTITDGSCVGTDLPWILALVQNSAGDAGSAGWWACALLVVLFFMDKNIRAQPRKLLEALSEAGILISTLYLMFLLVSIIDFSFNFTGLTNFIALDIVEWLKTFNEQVTNNGMYLFIALVVTMALAIILGMGMPTVPAYLNVALLMSPLLVGLGIATFSAHMFIFYFAVASAITPPVAVAAFAASSITKGDPIATGFAAVKAGIVMFVIPFVFAFYPELLLIPAAQIDPTSEVSSPKFLTGYDGTIHWDTLLWLCARIAFALYLLASVLANFDRTRIGLVEGAVRLLAALLTVTDQVGSYGLGIVVGFGTLYWNAKKASPKILI
jgi:TRAP transporter 4TM/12TM fusion protein